jgi:adenosylcobinamide kinase/adenosylcobinamide-phosphate guanylyltransferase
VGAQTVTVTLVTGAARSGKSAVAERMAARQAERLGLREVVYIATAQASDDEMALRIRRHRETRPVDWRTVEEPLDVAAIVAREWASPVIVIDCLALLLNNWMFLGECDEAGFSSRRDELVSRIAEHPGAIVCVTNEVGSGIVPADPATRRYRDWLGWLNQAVASRASQVLLVVAGIAVDLRQLETRLS